MHVILAQIDLLFYISHFDRLYHKLDSDLRIASRMAVPQVAPKANSTNYTHSAVIYLNRKLFLWFLDN